MKTIIINESLIKSEILAEAIRFGQLPEPIRFDLIKNRLPLSNNPALPYDDYLDKVTVRAYENAKNFKIVQAGKATSNYLSKLNTKIQEIEKPIRPNLEQLCYGKVFDLFNIPDDSIDFRIELVDGIDDSKIQIPVHPNENPSEYTDMEEWEIYKSEVNKRRMISTLIIGAATYYTQIVLKNSKSELDALNPHLYGLYNDYLNINEYLLFTDIQEISDDNKQQSGINTVTIGNEEKKNELFSQATVFPVLIFETVRGLMEMFAAHGLPQNSDRVIGESDCLINEPWAMRVGPVMWDTFISSIKPENEFDAGAMPYIFKRVCLLSPKKFNKFIKEVLVNTKKGKEIIGKINAASKEINDRAHFEKRMGVAQAKYSKIEDGFIDEEQINEFLDKKWGMPLKNELLSWVDDYIDEYYYEYPEWVKEQAGREWGFRGEELEDLISNYVGLSKEEMLGEINFRSADRLAFAKWLYERHSRFDNNDEDDEDGAYEMRPIEGLGDTLGYKEDVNNKWLIHFTGEKEQQTILQQGFSHSATKIEDLRATTDWRTKFGSEGYNFAYLADDITTYHKGFFSFGSRFALDNQAIMFMANGISIYHKGDTENQVIFTSNSAKNIIPLYNENGVWCVRSRLNGKILHREPLSQEVRDKYDISHWLPNGQKQMERGRYSSGWGDSAERANENLHNLVIWVMNNFEQYRKHLVYGRHSLNESVDGMSDALYDAYEEISEGDIFYEFLRDKRNGIKTKQWQLIPAQQYYNLLQRYMQMGEFARIPEHPVRDWMNLVIHNSIELEMMTRIAGHADGPSFPYDDFEYAFGEDYSKHYSNLNYHDAWDYLESIGYDDWAKLPDGSDALSDYGLKPIFNILLEYKDEKTTPEETLILINRVLDVYHCRGNLSSCFIEGGAKTCDAISNSMPI